MVHVAELEHEEASGFGEKRVLRNNLDVGAEFLLIFSISIIHLHLVQVCVPVHNCWIWILTRDAPEDSGHFKSGKCSVWVRKERQAWAVLFDKRPIGLNLVVTAEIESHYSADQRNPA